MSDGYSVDTQAGRVASGEPDSLFLPRSPRAGKRGVVLCHGFNSPYQYLDATLVPSSVRLAAYLAGNGITCVSGKFGSQTNGSDWANDEAMTRLTAAFALLVANGCASDKFCIYGISMGGATAMRYAMLNPSKVAAVYCTAPVCDLTDMYVNNRAAARTSIGTAWSVAYPAPLPSGADLVGQAHLASAIPNQIDYGTADAVIIPSTIPPLATAWGSNCTATVVNTTDGHGDALFGSTDPQAVFSFLVANGC